MHYCHLISITTTVNKRNVIISYGVHFINMINQTEHLFSDNRQTTHESNMDNWETRHEERVNEGVWDQPPEILGPGNCDAGNVEENPAPKSHTVSVDEQF